MPDGWEWDTSCYPRAIINLERTVRLARLARDSTLQEAVFCLTHYENNYYFRLDSFEQSLQHCIIYINPNHIRDVVEIYGHPHNTESQYSVIRDALADAIISLVHLETFSSTIMSKYKPDNYTVTARFTAPLDEGIHQMQRVMLTAPSDGIPHLRRSG